MNSRDKILSSIRAISYTTPVATEAEWKQKRVEKSAEELVKIFCEMGVKCGGAYRFVSDIHEMYRSILNEATSTCRIITTYKDFEGDVECYSAGNIVPAVDTVDVAILKGSLGVIENGAVWLTEDHMIDRAVPFLCKHLVLIIDEQDIVVDMHEAYEKIGKDEYGFGCFIAGPSKTADIEQSLVIGAHGPVRSSVFILKCLRL